jgi:multisubunit Na+/H+ antiporter MnhF subunit
VRSACVGALRMLVLAAVVLVSAAAFVLTLLVTGPNRLRRIVGLDAHIG